MLLKPLTPENLEEAIALATVVFPEDMKDVDNPPKAFRASLEPKKYANFFAKYFLKTQVFFLVYDEATHTVAGITSLYYRTIDEPGIVWLGWYGIHPMFRGKGLGQEVLLWTMEKARHEHNHTMRLYTSSNPDEAAAQYLYEKLGFKIIPKEIAKDPYSELMEEIQSGEPATIIIREVSL